MSRNAGRPRNADGTFISVSGKRGADANRPFSDKEPTNGNEAEVVETALLSNLLRVYVKDFAREHPVQNQVDGKIAAFESLSSGRIYPRMLHRIYNCDHKMTSLSIADALLQQMNLTHLLTGRDPVIPIVPNPRWSQERWIAYMRDRGCI